MAHTSTLAASGVTGTRLPLVQAPMAGSQGTALACAVATAGGLGSLPAAMLNAAALEGQLQELQRYAQAALNWSPGTPLPFNLNFFCHRLEAANPQSLEQWRQQLAPYAQALGVKLSGEGGPVRRPFDAEMAALVEAYRPSVVSFHFGLPDTPLLERVRATGARIWSSATTLEEALWLEAAGIDAVIAQGWEAGGHRGHFLEEDLETQCGTMGLVAQAVQGLSIPVIAAGGIADAAGVQAALALGAQAVQVGTAFLCCPEASTSAVHRQALCHPGVERTSVTTLFSGRPARGIVNALMRDLGPRPNGVPAFPWASGVLQPLRQAAEAQGKGDFSPLWCGQVPPRWPGLSAAEVVARLMRGVGTGAKGYWIARGEVDDLQAYQAYVQANGPAFAAYGARFLVRGGRFETPEGESRSRNVVLEFPSVQAAHDCWHSEAYQAALALRRDIARLDLIIIEGYQGAQPSLDEG